ncbi:Hint domain-containing protein, partial [Asaia sp. HN010]|uniref:Hint domain-containing protein n=1 Tax=Asaia sp. HN010 TaxID=3081233 RepID=UPI0030194300
GGTIIAGQRTWGMISGVSIQSGGTALVSSGGAANYVNLNGGNVYLSSGALHNNVVFGVGGGSLHIGSQVSWGGSITSGGLVEVSSGGTAGNAYVASGGTLLAHASAFFNNIDVVPGGTVVLEGATSSSGPINLIGDGADVVIRGLTMPSCVISGFSKNDRLTLSDIKLKNIASVKTSNDGTRINMVDGSSYFLNINNSDKIGYSLISADDGSTIYETCFAEGTKILTPTGYKAIEHLRIDDLVNTPVGAKKIRWVGSKNISVLETASPDENWLVCIRKDSLAENTPSRDLFVTQEHCLVFDNFLVPVRMLINNYNIFLDKSIKSYRYYHIELPAHEAIWAEGTLTESYKNTGNLAMFDNAYLSIGGKGDHNSAGESRMMLNTSRDFVEPIYNAIMQRSGNKNIVDMPTTHDANVRISSDAGNEIKPTNVSNNVFIFPIPLNTQTLRVLSRSVKPSDLIGPFVDDRRNLGILIDEIRVFNGSAWDVLDFGEQDLFPRGWYKEHSQINGWTNGDATIVLPICTVNTPRTIAIRVVAGGPYFV